MRKITIKNKSIPANPRSDNYPAGSTVMRSGNGSTTIIGGGSGSPDIDILKTTDNKSATDRNVFSALRACSEFISKKANDTVQGIIDFAQGIKLKHKSITDLVCSGEETELSDSNILSSSKTVEVIEQRAISRLRDDNTAGHITFEKGITTLNLLVQELAHTYDLQVDHVATLFQTIIKDFVSSETFVPGMMGEGMKLYKALSGDWNLELDNVTVRKAITTFEMVIAKIRAVNGGLVVSAANGSVKSVSETTGDPAYYVLGIEGDMTFAADDLVRCQVFTSGRVKHYWLPIEQINGDSILLLKSGFPDGVTPAVGDELVQMGNRTDTSRQGVLYLTASEDGRPRFSVLDGINSPSLDGKNNTVLGCLDGITDTDLPADFQPSGYGLYSMNVFLKGIFILRNGKSIEQALTELSTQIEAIPGQISMKVTEEVGKMQIGGRNYVRDSHETYSVSASISWQRMPLANGMVAGEKYILSLQTVVNDGVIFMVTNDNNIGSQIITPGIPFVLLEPKKYFAFTNNGFDVNGSFYNIKIEKGTNATDWTPAPEDIETRMSQAELSLKPENIWMGIKSNLQAFGRNYFKKSTSIISLYGTPTIDRNHPDCPNGVYLVGDSSETSAVRFVNVINSNGYWTISFDLRGSQGVDFAGFTIDICDGDSYRVTVTPDNDWRHHEFTVNVQNYTSNVYNFVDFEMITWAYLYVRNLKIEKGSIATDWTPAPEDADDRLTHTGIDIVNRKIVLSADKTVFRNNSGGQIAVFENDRIKADLIDARQIVVNGLNAGKITTGNLNVTEGAEVGPFVISSGGYMTADNKVSMLGMTYGGRSTQLSPGTLSLYTEAGDALLITGGGGITLNGNQFNSNCSAYSFSGGAMNINNSSVNINNAVTLRGGVCVNVRKVYASSLVWDSDYFIACYNTSSITLTLPNNPQIGRTVIVKRMNNSNIRVNGGSFYRTYAADAKDYQDLTKRGELHTYVFDGQYWQCNWHTV